MAKTGIDLEFKDSKGIDVSSGDLILIEEEYGRTTHTGKTAVVFWNKNYGQYELKYNGCNRSAITFRHIKKFTKVNK